MDNNSSPTLISYIRKSATTLVTVMFGLQLLRVLLPSLVAYLRESVGVGSLDLAPIAFGIFGLSFLAGPLWRFTGPRTALWISAGGIAVIRIAEQLSTSAQLDYYLSAVGVALFLIYIPIGLALVRDKGKAGSFQFGLAFMLGLAADTAIHIGAGTLDLSWQTGIVPVLVVLALAMVLLDSVRTSVSEISAGNHSEGHWSGTSALFVLGTWILLQMLVFQNVARVSSLTGWGTPAAGALILFGNALGLAAAIRLAHSSLNAMIIALGSGLVLTLAMLSPDSSGVSAALQLTGGQILSFILAAILFAGFGRGNNTHGIARSAIANGFGNIIFVLLTFMYYVSIDISLGFRAQMLLPVGAILITIGALIAARGNSPATQGVPNYKSATFAGALLIIPLVLSFMWITPASITPSASNNSIRVMSYNVHNGANTDGRIDLEAIAQVIEDSGADVIGFQEIARGWLIWGSPDMLTWLSQRLDMPYFYGPTEGAQWGNAILSRYPIIGAENIPLSPDDLLLRRGFIQADIDVGDGTLTVIVSHFTAVDDQDAERDSQSSQLIDAWRNGAATIIMGDFNARPDENAYAILLNSGLVDISAEIGTQPTYTFKSTNPDHQIDFIFASSDLGYMDFVIPQTIASDHLPLVVTIILR